MRGLLFGATLACCAMPPLSASTQESGRLHRVGLVSLITPSPENLAAFRGALRDRGYVEGRNLVLEVRSAEGRQERLAAIVSELVGQRPGVLVTVSTATALAAQKATTTLPIVFVSVIDPVAPGIVKSLSRPGGNLTGITGWVGSDFAGKWVGLLKESVPHATRFAVLWNSANPQGAAQVKEIARAARESKVNAEFFEAGGAAALDATLARIGESGAQAMVVAGDPIFTANRKRLVDFAARRRLPAIYFFRSFVDAGGLMAYGARQEESYRRAATYVDRILKGARPADLPVERPAEFQLVINMRTAKALGLAIPRSLLLRADQVME